MEKDIHQTLKGQFPLICRIQKPITGSSEDGERIYSWAEHIYCHGCKAPNVGQEKVLSRRGWIIYTYSYLLNGNFDITEDMRLVEDEIYDIKRVSHDRLNYWTVLKVTRVAS